MFYDTEISLRKQLKYPPFCDIIVIGFSSENEERIKKISNFIYDTLEQKLNNKDLKVVSAILFQAVLSAVKSVPV